LVYNAPSVMILNTEPVSTYLRFCFLRELFCKTFSYSVIVNGYHISCFIKKR